MRIGPCTTRVFYTRSPRPNWACAGSRKGMGRLFWAFVGIGPFSVLVAHEPVNSGPHSLYRPARKSGPAGLPTTKPCSRRAGSRPPAAAAVEVGCSPRRRHPAPHEAVTRGVGTRWGSACCSSSTRSGARWWCCGGGRRRAAPCRSTSSTASSGSFASTAASSTPSRYARTTAQPSPTSPLHRRRLGSSRARHLLDVLPACLIPLS